jgi:excisionase family DNA binding protein
MKPDDDAMTSPIMTTPEVARYLRIHYSTLYKLIRQGRIPAFKIGADYRFKRDAIEKLLTDREEKRRPPKSASSAFVQDSPTSSE